LLLSWPAGCYWGAAAGTGETPATNSSDFATTEASVTAYSAATGESIAIVEDDFEVPVSGVVEASWIGLQSRHCYSTAESKA
jgi:hypothetical protein